MCSFFFNLFFRERGREGERGEGREVKKERVMEGRKDREYMRRELRVKTLDVSPIVLAHSGHFPS